MARCCSSLMLITLGVRAQCEQSIHYVLPGGDDPGCHRSPSHLRSCELPWTLVLAPLVTLQILSVL